jgi:hypothetical protein
VSACSDGSSSGLSALAAPFRADGVSRRVMEYGKKGSNKKFQQDAEKAFVSLVELGRSNTSR